MTRDPARRGEWLLMYTQGLDAADIARICHTLPHHAEAYLREQVERDPNLFDRRLSRCLQPSLPVFRHEDATRGWDGNRLSLARFIQSRGRFPRRSADTATTAGALEVFLYHWVRAQRAASAGGRLTGRQERRLEAIDRWTVLGHDHINTRHWNERLQACADFVEAHGHLPRYRNGKTTLERSLGTWLSRQQSRRRRGVIPGVRAEALGNLVAAGPGVRR
ncbi:MAG: helicase associated domain-containing protein [Micrococcaceae bacterium]|nr:helicase associated domain-containing protein [Micrococcaceae bacterium]MDN5905843.1 helicase associated domain-containing protein [Micrococcaceae bacterium]